MAEFLTISISGQSVKSSGWAVSGGWGNGVVIIGILLGIAVAACSLRDFLRFTERKARESAEKEKEL